MKHYLSRIHNESGVVLVTGLVIMVLLTAIGTYAIHLTEIDTTVSGNLKASKQAFYLAEAGIQHAKILLNQNKNSWGTYAYATPQPLISATQLSTIGTYAVTIRDAGGESRRVISTGNTSSNARAVIETLMHIGSYTPEDAITVGGNLTISGNPTVTGTKGGVHANGSLSISGSPEISADATASGTYSSSGNPDIGGLAAGAEPIETIPTINPADFASSADYHLTAAGNVLDRNGVLIFTASSDKWNGWNYSSGKWTLSRNTTINATLYIEGDAVISGNPGSTTDPWVATVIATGSIEVTGTPIVRPPIPTDPSPLFRSGTENLLFVAGKDLKITGNAQQSFEGILAAHEQVRVSGNATITGFIIAEDAAHAGMTVTEDAIGGNMQITYGSTLTNPLPGDVEILTWQHL